VLYLLVVCALYVQSLYGGGRCNREDMGCGGNSLDGILAITDTC
jgi:hypothetical protein